MKMSDDTRVLLAQFALEANIIDACFQIDDGDNNTKRGSTSVGFSIDNKSTSLYNQEAAKGGARKGLSTRKQGVSPKPPRKSLK
jgi:hypothetical protein